MLGDVTYRDRARAIAAEMAATATVEEVLTRLPSSSAELSPQNPEPPVYGHAWTAWA